MKRTIIKISTLLAFIMLCPLLLTLTASADPATPVVTGVKAHVTGTELSGGVCKIKADSLETFFKSTTTSVTMETFGLYTDQACSAKLTTSPVSGTAYYFIVAVNAYEDGNTPTLTWSANDVLKAGSDISADNADVEIVEFFHSPAGGSLSVIVKYTEKTPGNEPPETSEPADVPPTGDAANFLLWIGLILLGLIGISVLRLTATRYRK